MLASTPPHRLGRSRKFRPLLQRWGVALRLTGRPLSFFSAPTALSGNLRDLFLGAMVLLSPVVLWAQGVSFPATPVTGSSAVQSVTVTAKVAGTVSAVRVLTLGAGNLDYADVGSGSCDGTPTLAAGAQCSVNVQFTPNYPGVRPGAVVLLGAASTVLGTEYLTGVGNGGLGVFVPGTIETIAGNGNFTSLGDGGAAIEAGLKLPFGVAVDGAGNVFIADSGEFRIRKVNAQTLLISTIAGTGNGGYTGDHGPATSATLDTPNGLTLDGAGNLFFADSTDHVVRRIDAVTQTITTVAGTGNPGSTGDGGAATAARLDAPEGVTVDPAGNLYIADTGNDKVRRVDAVTGIITTVAGIGFVSQSLGDGGSALSASLNKPAQVAFDPGGDMLIADAGDNRIRRVDATTGVITTVAGTGTQAFGGDGGAATQAELYSPSSIVVDPAGNLYIGDTENNRVRKVVDGIIYTIVGNGTGKFAGDGFSAAAAGIYGPYFTYLDATGSLYIGDYFDNRIRKVPSNQVILTYPTAIRVEQRSEPQDQSLENDGNQSLTLASVAPDANAALDPASTTCAAATVLPVDAACVLGAEFAPSQVGNPVVGNILVGGNAGDAPLDLQVVGQSLALNTTDITLLATPNPSTFGQTVSLIATVSSGTGSPTGTVTFTDGGTSIGTATLNGSDTATFNTVALAAGPHTIVAVYAGDSEHGGSSSPSVTQVVSSSTATTVSSSADPAVVKTTITFTANVVQNSGSPASSASAPTGSVIFYDGSTVLGTGTLNASGNATLSTSALLPGPHTIIASYNGNTYNITSTSAGLSQTVTQQQTATALAASANPAFYGSAVTYSATVTVTGTGPATGSVLFFDGSTQIGSGTLNGSGLATFSSSTLAAGAHSLTAHYSGDVDDSSSISSALNESIEQATTSDILSATPNPAIAGKPLTLSAAIADLQGGGTATGAVTFHDAATSLGTASLSGSDVATIAPTLGPGTHSLTSTYPGDLNHSGSNGSLSLVVQQAATAVVVTSTPNPSVLGAPVSFTIQVTGNGGVPSGNVTLFADSTAISSATTLSNGSATITTSALPVGAHAITATYAGDTNDAGSATTQPYTQTVSKAASSVTVTGSPNPVIAGNNVTFQAVVKGTNGNPIPTGSVEFYDGATALGTTPVVSGTATLATSGLPTGEHTIAVTYGGDMNYTGASATVMENVQRTTSVALSATANPSIAGRSVTFSMQVTGSAPSGSITLLDGSSTLAILTLNGTGAASFSTATLLAGTHALTASYAGDGSNGSATSPVLTEVIEQATTSTSLSASANPATAGNALTLTAAVSGNGDTPGGRVNFYDSSRLLGSATLNGSGVATLSITSLSPGSHNLSDTYLGDTNDLASTSAPLSESILQAVTHTALTVSPNPAVVTHSTLLTAEVTGDGSAPTGSVTFSVGSTVLGTVSVASSGTATFSTTALPLGSSIVTAAYSGDVNNAASQVTALASVVQALPALLLQSSLNPSLVGSPVTFTATASALAGTPAGTVTFADAGSPIGVSQLSAGGTATLSVSSLSLGAHTITASYSGNADNAAAQAPPLSQTVQQTTTTQIAASANPVLAGEPLTLTAAVLGANGSAPRGSVVFEDGAVALASATLTGGRATLTIHTLATGTHVLTAVYSGDSLDRTSTASPLTEDVQSANTVTTIGSSGSPSLFGASVTFTATVKGGGTVPTGTVTFAEGSHTLGVGPLQPNGSAFLTNNTLAPGSHLITASYGGDSDNLASQSAILTQVVQAQTTTSLTVTPLTAVATTPMTLSARVVSNAGTHPGGTITFKDGASTLGTAALDANESASLTVSTLTSGSHALTASYSGDALDQASTSAAVDAKIQAIPTNVSLGSSAASVTTGQPFTLIAAVTSSGTAPFTGTVTFTSGATVLGTSSVDPSGAATLAPSLAAGTYTIIATYSGDAFNAPAASTPVLFTVTQAADYKITLNPASLSMASKQNAPVQITLQSLAGFTDTIGLGCASLPRLVTCTFSKDVVSLAANGTVSVSVTVDTASPLASGSVAADTGPRGKLRIALGCLLPGAGLLGWMLRRRANRCSVYLVWLLAALAAGSTIMLSGCNGLSSNGAAPGTYTIQITGSGQTTGVNHTVDLSLTVTQ